MRRGRRRGRRGGCGPSPPAPARARASSRCGRTRGICRAAASRHGSATLAAPPARRSALRTSAPARAAAPAPLAAAPDPAGRRSPLGRKPRSRISRADVSGCRPSEVASAGSTALGAVCAVARFVARCGDPLGHVDADHLRPSGAKAEPREQGAVAGRRQHHARCAAAAPASAAPAAAARKAARQRVASGLSTAGMNRSSAPIVTPSRVTARRCSRSSAASGPATASRATMPPSSTSAPASARTAGAAAGSLAQHGRRRAAGPSAALGAGASQSFEPRDRPPRGRCRRRGRSARSSRMRGASRFLPRPEPRHLMPAPQDRDRRAGVGAQRETLVSSATSAAARFSYSLASRRSAAASSSLRSAWRARRIDLEAEALEPADRIGPDADLAFLVDQHREFAGALVPSIAHQHGGAPVDEALGQPLRAARRTASPRPRAVRAAHVAGSASQSARCAI